MNFLSPQSASVNTYTHSHDERACMGPLGGGGGEGGSGRTGVHACTSNRSVSLVAWVSAVCLLAPFSIWKSFLVIFVFLLPQPYGCRRITREAGLPMAHGVCTGPTLVTIKICMTKIMYICVFFLFCVFPGWQLGALMCKAAPYLQGVAVCASVNTLAAIALDRYVQPIGQQP